MMADASFTFPKSRRLRLRRDFDRVFADRVAAGNGHLVVFVCRNGLDHPRIGLSVGRRIGNAVKRNRVKRLLREAFRLEQHGLPAGVDIVCVVKNAESASLERYRETLPKLIARAVRKLEKSELANDSA